MNRQGFGTFILVFVAFALVVAIAGLYFRGSLHLVPSLRSATSTSQLSSDSFVDAPIAQAMAASALSQLSKYTFLSLVPINRNISLFHPTSSQQFSSEGITLRLPWSGSPTIQSLKSVGTQIKFPDKNFVMLANPYPNQDIRQMFLSSARTTNNDAKLNYLFGMDTLQSNSAFFNLVLSASLPTLSDSASSAKDLFAQAMLLPIKLTLFYDPNAQAIFRFATSRFQVWEITNLPTKNQSYLFLYDHQDNGRLITTSADQNEIDFIVASINE